MNLHNLQVSSSIWCFGMLLALIKQLESPKNAPGHSLKTLCLNWMRKLGIYSLTEAHGRAAKAHGRAYGAGQCVVKWGLCWPRSEMADKRCTVVHFSAHKVHGRA